MDWQDLIIGGVPLAALIVGLVNLAKRLGLPDQYAPYLNGALAALGFLLVSWLLPAYPQIEPFLEVAAGAVIAFLAASGIHQLGKTD